MARLFYFPSSDRNFLFQRRGWRSSVENDRIRPAGGFDYQRKPNSEGEEVGGMVPRVTLKSIAKDGAREEEVLVDRPEADKKDQAGDGRVCGG